MLIYVLACTPPQNAVPVNVEPSQDHLTLHTSMGQFDVELYTEAAPITVANFLTYVEEGFYDGADGQGATVFHRVISEFMIQGGGFTTQSLSGGELQGPEGYVEKSTRPPITNEAQDSGLFNVRGTLAMARTEDPDSATSQFFINVVDNLYLDANAMTEEGYAVFGFVSSGMEIVDAISEVAVNSSDAPYTDVVLQAVEYEAAD